MTKITPAMFKKVPGTRDILSEECYLWQKIEEISRNIFSIYNYHQIRTPIIEDAGLFNRSLGELSEVVQKQMFLINNKQDSYALRPEGTAGIVRAYIENNLDKTAGLVKFYYLGPMFRLERPQKGRLRQFHHIGAEVIGSAEPYLDAEVISLADNLLKACSVSGYDIKINSLGCPGDKLKLVKILNKGLKDNLGQLCDDCKTRFERNVLRVLDCKDEVCQGIVSGLHIQDNYLCEECKEHFASVQKALDYLNIKYEISPYLVRGLDYYTRTVFEIKHPCLGAQDAIGAGGRYDTLTRELGGPDLAAIGFAVGVERLLLAGSREPEARSQNNNLVYIISIGKEAKIAGLKLLNNLRAEGIVCDTDYESRSLKSAMRRANDLGARVALIIGENELKNKTVSFKDMVSGEQREVGREKIIGELKVTLPTS